MKDELKQTPIASGGRNGDELIEGMSRSWMWSDDGHAATSRCAIAVRFGPVLDDQSEWYPGRRHGRELGAACQNGNTRYLPFLHGRAE